LVLISVAIDRTEIEMWLFRKKSISRRQLRPFARFLSKEALRDIQENPNEFPPLQMEDIRYVVMQVRDDTPEHIQQHLSHAIDTVIDDGGVVEDIVSSILTVIFKPTFHSRDFSMDDLLAKLGPNVRAVYGDGKFLPGTIGSPRRFNYGTLFPDISRTLETLFLLEFGTSRGI
jgi:hypothetical protein